MERAFISLRFMLNVTRKIVWRQDLSYINSSFTGPWIVGGDFHVVLEAIERRGWSNSLDFSQCIVECDLHDLGYSGNDFTFCNNRQGADRCWSRIDRVLANDEWLECFPSSMVLHLAAANSDHRPLVLKADAPLSKPFRFLDMWTKHHSFIGTVSEAWNCSLEGSPMALLVLKLKKVKRALRQSDF